MSSGVSGPLLPDHPDPHRSVIRRVEVLALFDSVPSGLLVSSFVIVNVTAVGHTWSLFGHGRILRRGHFGVHQPEACREVLRTAEISTAGQAVCLVRLWRSGTQLHKTRPTGRLALSADRLAVVAAPWTAVVSQSLYPRFACTNWALRRFAKRCARVASQKPARAVRLARGCHRR